MRAIKILDSTSRIKCTQRKHIKLIPCWWIVGRWRGICKNVHKLSIMQWKNSGYIRSWKGHKKQISNKELHTHKLANTLHCHAKKSPLHSSLTDGHDDHKLQALNIIWQFHFLYTSSWRIDMIDQKSQLYNIMQSNKSRNINSWRCSQKRNHTCLFVKDIEIWRTQDLSEIVFP